MEFDVSVILTTWCLTLMTTLLFYLHHLFQATSTETQEKKSTENRPIHATVTTKETSSQTADDEGGIPIPEDDIRNLVTRTGKVAQGSRQGRRRLEVHQGASSSGIVSRHDTPEVSSSDKETPHQNTQKKQLSVRQSSQRFSTEEDTATKVEYLLHPYSRDRAMTLFARNRDSLYSERDSWRSLQSGVSLTSVESFDTLYSGPRWCRNRQERTCVFRQRIHTAAGDEEQLLSQSDCARQNTVNGDREPDFEADEHIAVDRLKAVLAGCVVELPQSAVNPGEQFNINLKCWHRNPMENAKNMVVTPTLQWHHDSAKASIKPVTIVLPTCYSTIPGGKLNIEWSENGENWNHLMEAVNNRLQEVRFQTSLTPCRFRATVDKSQLHLIQKHLVSVIFHKRTSTGPATGPIVWCLCDANFYFQAKLWTQMTPHSMCQRIAETGTFTIGIKDNCELKLVGKELNPGRSSTSVFVKGEDLWKNGTIKTFEFNIPAKSLHDGSFFVVNEENIMLTGVFDIDLDECEGTPAKVSNGGVVDKRDNSHSSPYSKKTVQRSQSTGIRKFVKRVRKKTNIF